MGFREQIKESTAGGRELVEEVLGVLSDKNASNRERMEAATWLADRGFGDFTIIIDDHDILGNRINPNSLPPERTPPISASRIPTH